MGGHEIGYDIPAEIGMAEADVQTPCLILDLDALEANIRRMGLVCSDLGVRHRAHGKMHKSADVARLQMTLGGAVGICAQKVSEAEAFVRAGIQDVLISNQVRGVARLDRLAGLPLLGARLSVCVDDAQGVADLAAAVARRGTEIGVLVEVDCGAARCGVAPGASAVALARQVAACPGLRYEGIQAYQGSLQHEPSQSARQARADAALAAVRATVLALTEAGLSPTTVTGGGTGSFAREAASGLYTEVQCGSYAFMDADYGRIEAEDGGRLDAIWRPALFVLTEVMSKVRPGRAVCDAGLKVMTLESGLPEVWAMPGVRYEAASDEHGTLADPGDVLRVGDRLRLVPGHCDPTCNLHDWYVGLRAGRVEALWPVTARGKAF